jgi:hypothetical protein
MNKNIVLVILAVALIPAFFNIGRGITGLAVNDTSAVASAPQGHFLSGVVLIYFIASIVILSIVASYLIALHNGNHKPKVVPKKTSIKHVASFHSHIKTAFAGIQGFRFAKIDDDRASQYIVAIVAIVGLIAILIMLF